jgi:hypothetical protein
MASKTPTSDIEMMPDPRCFRWSLLPASSGKDRSRRETTGLPQFKGENKREKIRPNIGWHDCERRDTGVADDDQTFQYLRMLRWEGVLHACGM